MSNEEIKLVGLFPDDSIDGHIKLRDMRVLLEDSLQLAQFYKALTEYLADDGYNMHDTSLLISTRYLFPILSKKTILEKISKNINGQSTSTNVDIIKAAIIIHLRRFLTYDEITKALVSYSLSEKDRMEKFIPYDVKTLSNTLKAAGRCISEKILKFWISHCSKYFKRNIDGLITPDEYLFLFCNTYDRQDTLNKLPRVALRIDKEIETNLFSLEQNISKDPFLERRLQNLIDADVENTRIRIEGLGGADYKKRTSVATLLSSPRDRKTQNAKKVKLGQNAVDYDEFRKALRNQAVFNEIKSTLTTANTLLNSARLGARLPEYLSTQRGTLGPDLRQMVKSSDINEDDLTTFNPSPKSKSGALRVPFSKSLRLKSASKSSRGVEILDSHRSLSRHGSYKSLNHKNSRSRPTTAASHRHSQGSSSRLTKAYREAYHHDVLMERMNNLVDYELSSYESQCSSRGHSYRKDGGRVWSANKALRADLGDVSEGFEGFWTSGAGTKRSAEFGDGSSSARMGVNLSGFSITDRKLTSARKRDRSKHSVGLTIVSNSERSQLASTADQSSTRRSHSGLIKSGRPASGKPRFGWSKMRPELF